ncbi:hypothetical protein [Cupriavidus oxalaticus]|uniref:hypothetical protein n=1 Tax=Cupriavidus oxalaticus TaxID=96344 RepID=UPI00124665FC|nr:hypothetical protein [Cupriavidus oxalaticus]
MLTAADPSRARAHMAVLASLPENQAQQGFQVCQGVGALGALLGALVPIQGRQDRQQGRQGLAHLRAFIHKGFKQGRQDRHLSSRARVREAPTEGIIMNPEFPEGVPDVAREH